MGIKTTNKFKTLSEKIIKSYDDDEYYKNSVFIPEVLGKHIVDKFGNIDDKSISQLQIMILPFIRFITNSISQLYSKPVLRSLNTEDKKILELFSEVTTSFDNISEDVDKYTFSGGMVALKSHFDDIDNVLEFIIYTSNMLDYTPRSTDYTKMDELYLSFYNDEVQQEEVWSSENYSYNINGSNSKDEENPYGFIPFEIFRNKKIPNSWFCPPASNLLDIQNYISNQNTQLGNNFKYQSMDMLVVKGGSKLENMNFGAKAINKVEVDEDIQFISPDTDLKNLVEVIDEQIKIFSRINGIPDSLISASATSSGVSLIISQKALDDYLKNRAIKFRQTEEKILLKGLKVLGYHKGVKIPEDLKISLNYTSANQMTRLTEDEQKMWDFYISKNVLTEVDLMISMFPNLTEDEAKEKIKLNEEYKKINNKEEIINTDNDVQN